MPRKVPAVFLDRDNTLIHNDGDLGDPEQVRLIQGAASAVASLRGLNYKVIVVTNQGGVARGKYGEDDVKAVHDRISQKLKQISDTFVDRYYFCPYHPEGTVEKYRREHPARKPQPGMLLKAAADLHLDLSQSWMIGDALRDVQAGKRAGTRTILLRDDGRPEPPKHAPPGVIPSADDPQWAETPDDAVPDFVAKNLVEAVRIIAQARRPESTEEARLTTARAKKWETWTAPNPAGAGGTALGMAGGKKGEAGPPRQTAQEAAEGPVTASRGQGSDRADSSENAAREGSTAAAEDAVPAPTPPGVARPLRHRPQPDQARQKQEIERSAAPVDEAAARPPQQPIEQGPPPLQQREPLAAPIDEAASQPPVRATSEMTSQARQSAPVDRAPAPASQPAPARTPGQGLAPGQASAPAPAETPDAHAGESVPVARRPRLESTSPPPDRTQPARPPQSAARPPQAAAPSPPPPPPEDAPPPEDVARSENVASPGRDPAEDDDLALAAKLDEQPPRRPGESSEHAAAGQDQLDHTREQALPAERDVASSRARTAVRSSDEGGGGAGSSDSAGDAGGREMLLRQILQELRNQHAARTEFSVGQVLAIILQIIAAVCLVGGLWMGADDMDLFIRWIAAGILVELSCIALLLMSRTG